MIARRKKDEDFNVAGLEFLFSIGRFIAEKEHRKIQSNAEMTEYLKELLQREVLISIGEGKSPGTERLCLQLENLAFGSDVVFIDEVIALFGG